MKQSWNARASDNAKWFINTLSLEQTDEEFYQSGQRDVAGLVTEGLALLTWGRDPQSLRMLEIGCGIGRMTRHLANIFGEVHGTDVSGEMIRQARERFRELPNTYFYETSGYDLAVFPAAHFDFILSAYVFQHVPQAEVIEANLREAFRVLKPGGIFKFQTSAVTNEEYLRRDKDTWNGAPFPESEVRRLARELGAQLLGVVGDGTQYCWSLLRKRNSPAAIPLATNPRILVCGPAEDLRKSALPPRYGDIYLGLIVEGVSPEAVDLNSVWVELHGRRLEPCYAGPVGIGSAALADPGNTVQLNLRLPLAEPGGAGALRVCFSSGPASDSITLLLPHPQARIPQIKVVTNAVDSGLDIQARGPKSRLNIWLDNLESMAGRQAVRVLLDEQEIAPENVTYLAGNALWEVTAQLPADCAPGQYSLRVSLAGVSSPATTLQVK